MKTSILTFALAILVSLGISLNISAQNLMLNGDMESWTGGVPDSWIKAENITQESSIIHGGSYSAKHTSDATTKDLMQEISGIEGGQEYTISFWYFDNDPMARARIWSYWLSGGSTLPDNADELRPSTYSEDNANWQQFSVTLTAPASADAFRFEVRVYKQDNQSGGSVYYDDFEFTGDVIVDPEPSNYPTGFAAIANGNSIDLNWTDATGAQLPSKYIVLASTDAGSFPIPVDGTPIPDDLDLSDGSGALNVPFGNEAATFAGLEGNTTYYFVIYPYTNSGANIDFKTDGTAPSANATTANISVIESEDFDDVSFGNWTPVSVVGDQEWIIDETHGVDGTPCAKMTGYDGQPYANEDWLISPSMNFDNYTAEVMNFQTAMNYTGNPLQLMVSTDYSGSGDPNAATWAELTYTMSGGSWVWTESGNVDLSSYSGSAVYVAFKFTSTDSESATWEVDEIVISGEGGGTPDPEPTNYPTGFTATANQQDINLAWTDATGEQLPDAYIIFAGTSATLPSPVDGTPVMNDLDLSDGSGALNVGFGAQQATFANLNPGTTYYFSVYPYTNSGADIDYKNDGTAPTANAIIPTIEEPTNYPTNFTADAISEMINLAWTDATGEQLPEAYIVFAGTSSSLPTPTDGIPTPDDLDLSDGLGAANVDYGVEGFTFSNLEPLTTYYFSIYPYIGSGSNIDYKNDGSAPTANATTEEQVTVVIESENFDESWGNWTTISVVGAQVWSRDNTFGIGDTPCATMTGYDGQPYENDDWLISPPLNLDNYNNEILVFQNGLGYTGPDLLLKISTDYDGGGDPYSATWTTVPFTMSSGFFEWTESGEIDLSGYDGSAVYIAFQFTSTDSESATWEVDDIVITGEENVGTGNPHTLLNNVTLFPNPSTGTINVSMSSPAFDMMKVYDLTGKLIKELKIDYMKNTFNFSELKKGIYFVSFANSETGQTVTKKLILK